VSINKYVEIPIDRAYNGNSLTNYGGVLKFCLFVLITSISISSFYIEYLYLEKATFTSLNIIERSRLKAGKTTFQIRFLKKSRLAGAI